MMELRGVSDGQKEQFIKIFPQNKICGTGSKKDRSKRQKVITTNKEIHYVSHHNGVVCGWMSTIWNEENKTVYINNIATLAAVNQRKYKGTGRMLFNTLLNMIPDDWLVYLYPLDEPAQKVYEAWKFKELDGLEYMVYQKSDKSQENMQKLKNMLMIHKAAMNAEEQEEKITAVGKILQEVGNEHLIKSFTKALANPEFVEEVLPGLENLDPEEVKAIIPLYGRIDFISQ
jgi:hypothetical protein